VKVKIILSAFAGFALIGVLTAVLGTGTSSSGTGKLQVVAAENFWGSLASQLGGDRVRVQSIITDPNTDPHSYEPTASDGRTIAGAKFVIVNGIGYDTWASHLIAANAAKVTVLNVGDLIDVSAGGNPHQWYSPEAVSKVIEQITTEYKRLDSGNASFYDQQRSTLLRNGLATYHRLISTIRSRYAGVPIGISESIFEPMARSLDLKLITPSGFYNAVAEGGDPSANDKATVDEQAMRAEIKVWVYNSQNATPDVQRVTSEAKRARVLVVTVTETPSPANVSFETWQVNELQALESALKQATRPSARKP
jgi:zinc/manganese transport system substrate-binding protein